MTLVPMLVVASIVGWHIYRDFTQRTEARRFLRIDYRSRDRCGRLTRR